MPMKNQISADVIESAQRSKANLPRRSVWLGITLLVCILALAFAAAPLLAQEGDAPSAAETSVDPSTISADQINLIARELWCPLCSGVRLDACELKACDQMKDEIAIKLAAGDGLPEIRAYFIDQYGPQVLGEPPREGFNLLAWALPILVMIGGGVFLVTRGRKIFRSGGPTETVAASASNEQATTESPPKDPYASQLEEELKQYD